jgi:hypothetical protein
MKTPRELTSSNAMGPLALILAHVAGVLLDILKRE